MPLRDLTQHASAHGPGAQCVTDKSLGKRTPQAQDPLRLVLHAPQGSIPLWAKDTTLRWRFRERSLIRFKDSEGVKAAIQELLGAAVLAWGDAAPIKFAYSEDVWDFEVGVRWADDCTISNGSRGCVLASAFFPDAGRHRLWLYPELFNQTYEEMVETLVHETGHCFGLRHYFAPERETSVPAEVFGEHKPFSIMNYGSQSVLTEADRADLKRLYEAAWSGELTQINGIPIQFVKPFSAGGASAGNLLAVSRIPTLGGAATGLG